MNLDSRQLLQSQKINEFQSINEVSEQIKVLMRSKNYAEVIKKCCNMSQSIQKYTILSFAYLGARQWRNLIQSCDKGLQFDIRQAQFYSLKAKALGKLGKYYDKILLLKQAIKLNCLNPSYHRNLGSAYYNIQSYDLAIEQYCKAIQLQPNNVLNYHNKGSTYLKIQNYQQAKKCFLKALDICPNLPLSLSWLADCEKMLGNYEEAEKLYQKAHQISGKEIYLQQINTLKKQKSLSQQKGSWFYGLAWLSNKLF